MKNQQKRVFILLILLFSVSSLFSADDRTKPAYVIDGCRIISLTSPPVEKGIIIMRDGLIEALGPSGKIAVPADAQIIDGAGLTAYPGLISAHSNLFLEIPTQDRTASQPGAATAAEPTEERILSGPTVNVFDLLKAKRETISEYHKAGILTVLVSPARSIFQGKSVILNLNGDDLEKMVLKNPFALHINFTTERQRYPSSLMGTIAYIRQSFYDAQRYASWKEKYEKNPSGLPRPEYSSFFEALIPYVTGRKPVVFQCNNQEDIGRAIKIIQEFKLNGILAGANEAWRKIPDLKKNPLPLLITVDFRPPASSHYAMEGEGWRKKAEAEIFPANPANLAKEKIPFALTSLGIQSPSAFIKNIKAAIRAGLSAEAALLALTVQPARYLGLDRQLGTLEPGKIANIILTRGEIFEDKSEIELVFVDGILFRYKEVPR